MDSDPVKQALQLYLSFIPPQLERFHELLRLLSPPSAREGAPAQTTSADEIEKTNATYNPPQQQPQRQQHHPRNSDSASQDTQTSAHVDVFRGSASETTTSEAASVASQARVKTNPTEGSDEGSCIRDLFAPFRDHPQTSQGAPNATSQTPLSASTDAQDRHGSAFVKMLQTSASPASNPPQLPAAFGGNRRPTFDSLAGLPSASTPEPNPFAHPPGNTNDQKPAQWNFNQQNHFAASSDVQASQRTPPQADGPPAFRDRGRGVFGGRRSPFGQRGGDESAIAGVQKRGGPSPWRG